MTQEQPEQVVNEIEQPSTAGNVESEIAPDQNVEVNKLVKKSKSELQAEKRQGDVGDLAEPVEENENTPE